MQLTVIAKPASAQTLEAKELKKAAQKQGVKINFLDIKNLNPDSLADFSRRSGSVILWRSASIGRGEKRTLLLKMLEAQGKYIFNPGLLQNPHLLLKEFQQNYLALHSKIATIPTFTFQNQKELLAALKRGQLKIPFVAKPNFGMQGQGIQLVESLAAIKKIKRAQYPKLIFQKNIPNQGDYRVLVLGGKALEVIKRVRKPGCFVNNLSRGGSGEEVEDASLRNTLMKLAEGVAAKFQFTFCGVDLIYDEEEKRLYFLEVNSVPQWRGIQKISTVNIATEVIKLAKALHLRNKKNPADLVERYYSSNLNFLRFKKFHYFSRLYLWKNDPAAKRELKKLKASYIGTTPKEIAEIIKSLLEVPQEEGLSHIKGLKMRSPYLKKYPQLRNYDKILSRFLFAKTIFGLDIRPQIRELIRDVQFTQLLHKLIQDKKAMATLSTYAINYVYLLENYLEKELVNKRELVKIAQTSYDAQCLASLMLEIYFYTHCIIGASLFYSKKIAASQKPIYLEMIKKLESVIYQNYFAISLDNKFEFLVCAKMLRFKTFLEPIIQKEAGRSLSPIGNFLVDTFNKKFTHEKEDFIYSEHRNVLFLMASQKRRRHQLFN